MVPTRLLVTWGFIGTAALVVGAIGMGTGCSSGGDDASQAAGDDAGGGGGEGGPTGPGGVLPGPSRGSAVALSPDDSVAAMVNRDVGTLSVFGVQFPSDGASATLQKSAEVTLGSTSEPWQVVIGPDGDTAYVVLKHDQKLAKVTGIKSGSPSVYSNVAVGSEPTSVALSPTGATAWVANWVDGTVTAVDTASMKVKDTVDLNAALVATHLVGDIAPRPALAHPRSVVVTNNGDAYDDDESVLVTEYFAQRVEKEGPGGANADTNKEGLVYRIKVADKSVSTIPLQPLADMGFKDHNGGSAACYPNQLQSIAVAAGFAYVTSICASPFGPVGAFTGPTVPCPGGDSDCPGAAAGSCNTANHVCKTNCTTDAQCGANGGKCGATAPNVCAPNVADIKTTTAPLVSVIDLAKSQDVARVSLNAAFVAKYTAAAGPDDASRRLPDVPADIAFVPGGTVAYVAGNAADAAFRVRFQGSDVAEIGASTNPFIDLAPAGIAPTAAGKNPIGVAVSNTGKHFMFVANDVSRNLTVVDLNAQAIAGGVAAPVVGAGANLPAPGSPEDHVLKGKHFFETGTARWSLKGQAWGSCQNCHADGLTDNVTWYFARGPRQSTSLDGTFSKKDPNDQRILNWTAINDEVSDFELNTRGISGGVGAIVSATSTPPAVTDRIDIQALGHAGLSGSADQAADPANPAALAAASVLDNWKDITAYVKTIRSPRAPSNLDAAKVAAGRQLFSVDGACQGCHGGDKWTISKRFYSPSATEMSALKAKAWTPPAGFPATLLPASTNRFMRFAGTDPAHFGDFDQIQCVLRPVGTFGVADDIQGIQELRANMTTPGQGNEADGKGFNPPSLLGSSTGAPYLHGGNATSLESLFDQRFAAHHGALAPNFLTDADPQARAQKVAQLVQFLLSIDADAAPVTIPSAGAQGGDFCSQ